MTESAARTCPITTDITWAARVLREGGLVAIATETVYGLAANALDEHAVARIFEAKARPFFDPLIVHIASRDWLNRLVSRVPPAAEKLATAFWPGPLTMVLPKTDLVPDLVTSGLPSVAIRMPVHPQARELLQLVDLPLAAPSANPFGQLSPTCAQHVAETLGDRIDLILDGGPSQVGVESTVVFVFDDTVRILRHGGITREALERVVRIEDGATQVAEEVAAPSPGMLPQHYAPRTSLKVLSNRADLANMSEGRIGALLLTAADQTPRFAAVEVLTTDGNLATAAANFFAALRRLDRQQVDVIVAYPFPDEGLGRALNDRLSRAAH